MNTNNEKRVARTARGYRCGSSHHRARWSDDVVARIRYLHADGMGYVLISRATGVPRSTVRAILQGVLRYAVAVAP